MDLVEPNPTGYEEMMELFSKNKIDPKSWNLFKCMIEDYNTDKLYIRPQNKKKYSNDRKTMLFLSRRQAAEK